MSAFENLRYETDGSTSPVTAEELLTARSQFDQIIEAKNFDRVAFRSCWLCNQAHFHLAGSGEAEEETFALRCFSCGRLFLGGIDITRYSSESS